MKQRPLWIADQVRNDNLAVIPAKAGIHASNEAAAAVDCGQVRNGNLAVIPAKAGSMPRMKQRLRWIADQARNDTAIPTPPTASKSTRPGSRC
jgi:hypothetical protein